jgi:ATP-dependent DNA helicase RecG
MIPIYPSSEVLKKNGIDNRFFISLISNLLEISDKEFAEFIPEEIIQKLHLLDRKTASYYVHQPETIAEADLGLIRFKYEEMLAFQWTMECRRKNYKTQKAPVFEKVGEKFHEFYSQYLPFELTDAQKRVIREIRKDCAKPFQMNRLLQGDVGSGKTIVAFLTMLLAIDNNYQCALMAPTEILATQHYQTIVKWAEPLQIEVALLTGSTKEKQKQYIIHGLLNNQIKILIGTHALIEDYVQFANLGLTIIDEQHKFGVEQRAQLWKKRSDWYPHNLVMTATPIPRTLALTLYGDLDLSIIDQLPKGRKPIVTKIVMESQRLQLFSFIKKHLQKGRQVYFIYPLVEESMKLDLIAVKKGYEAIQRSFPNVRNCSWKNET